MMEPGDILICIRSIKNTSEQILFTKNKPYMIYEINSSSYGEIQYYIKDNLGYTGPAFYPDMIIKYFITQKELRKQKLNKLSNIS